MGSTTLWLLLSLAVIVWLVFALRGGGSQWRQLIAELDVRLPVFSAETARATEAEFIRDRLPRRPLVRAVLLAAFGIALTLIWLWLR